MCVCARACVRACVRGVCARVCVWGGGGEEGGEGTHSCMLACSVLWAISPEYCKTR